MPTMMDYWVRYRIWLQSTWGDHLFNRWINTAMVIVHVGFGLVVIFASPLRFSSDTYEPLLDISHGHIWAWGVVIILSGYLMVLPWKWANVLGLWVGMAWMATWTALFIFSLFLSQEASPFLVIACGGFALINTALLTSRVIDSEHFGW